MPSVFAIIPARSGSKGVPGKNVKLLGGRSLLEWSVKACLKSKFIDDVYVSTDSQEYANLAICFGAKAPFLRPREISGDTSTDLEFMKQSLAWFRQETILPDYIVHIRPTTPFRSPVILDEAIKLFVRSKNFTALRSVHEMSESAYKSLEISCDGFLKELMSENTSLDAANEPRQSFPKTFMANGYVDVLSVSFIQGRNQLHGDRVLPFVTPEVVEVDTLQDFDYLEYQLSKNSNYYDQLFIDD